MTQNGMQSACSAGSLCRCSLKQSGHRTPYLISTTLARCLVTSRCVMKPPAPPVLRPDASVLLCPKAASRPNPYTLSNLSDHHSPSRSLPERRVHLYSKGEKQRKLLVMKFPWDFALSCR